MQDYLQIFLDGYYGYWNYLSSEILYPSWHNYFWWLLGISVGVWGLELVFPWRKNQAVIREDFWLDGFYMFFNFFLFSLIGYNAVSNVAVEAFSDFLGLFNIENLVAIQVASWPAWSQFLLLFVVADFIQWNVHRMLHHSPWLWEFHKVHHSVEEMGFAAHLRYHWMETVVYKSVQYIPLAMIGFGLDDFFILHLVTIVIGHLNHANVKITYGPLKYVLNNPVMHLWHHAKELPTGSHGVNYGISLSLWDYLFGTAYIPNENANEPLGFENLESFPKTFWNQLTYPWNKKK
ncbi:MAG: sterol desaturase family protein [Algoriphagus sp.]|jgi:sterol desaturase/sphingolipid hydroxylase (fatty acid hydroxylase superfamily)|uniref:sterol desaturase family protein n=1 Tax=Algoriphagus sp. TaxID=1872435 RepID=UPI0027608BF9|nr:sterol desaturase family protein [Algoriphagus sp.]MDP4748295.1 sterol desaturase family protein [Algoriphagus sp.]MDP4839350.1 sterol desaturase family protein [Algoriphagus sp.]MDP4904402.1 sterol desaturase family protein [Algoriphagus sp.]MDP5125106.1 sterol desaturase family protein [Algoriphagus sp.]